MIKIEMNFDTAAEAREAFALFGALTGKTETVQAVEKAAKVATPKPAPIPTAPVMATPTPAPVATAPAEPVAASPSKTIEDVRALLKGNGPKAKEALTSMGYTTLGDVPADKYNALLEAAGV